MRLRLAILASAVAGMVLPVGGAVSPACAAEGPHAVLVIDRGSEGGAMDPFCVALDAETVSGRHLIELAARQYEEVNEISFGYGGQALCMLADIGSAESDCLETGEPFWGYWRSDGDGWQWSSSGFASTSVEDGDVEGWSWDEETGPEGREQPPHPGFGSVCGYRVGEGSGSGDNPREQGGDGREEAGDEGPKDDARPPAPGGRGGAASGPSPPPRVTDPQSDKPPRLPNAFPSAESEPDERWIDAAPELSELADTPTEEPPAGELPVSATTAGAEDDGFPLAGGLALLATFAMAGVAILLVRQRTPPTPGN